LPGISFERFATGLRADFRFAPVNALLLVLIYVAGLIVHLSLYPFSVIAVELALGSAVVLAILLRLTQVWEAAVLLGTADALVIFLQLRPESEALLITAVVAMFVAPSVQIAYQWERAVILRLGRFKALRESGPFLIVPIVDKVAQFVDQRVRVSDFSAETTLTADTVPVNVDAIAFWMVCHHVGADGASERHRQERPGRPALRARPPGPRGPEGPRREDQRLGDHHPGRRKGLEDAMSRQAQAERERQSRIILGTAETEIAEKFASASEHYRDNPVALHLRAMNMVYEGLRQKGSMIIVPSTAVETMGLGALGGLTAFGKGLDGDPAASMPAGGGADDAPTESPESS
jgi:hypothetical protein